MVTIVARRSLDPPPKVTLAASASGPLSEGRLSPAPSGGCGGALPAGADGLGGPPRSCDGAKTPTRRGPRVHGDHDDPSHAFAVPRFPPAHTSAAFEALAVRKSLILTPPEIYAECAHHGEEKAAFGWLKLVMLCVIAGCYVGFGFTLCLMVGGNLGSDIYTARPGLFSLVYGAVGFPAAFTMIVVCGAELYTSMCAYMAAAWWEGRVSIWTCIRMWVVSWCGNFAGCAMFTGLIVATKIFEGRDWYALLMATKKVSHGFGNTLVRGIFANWLVGIATWQANAAQDLSGKAIAVWLPISAFAMLGWEHSIANQYLLPLSIALEPGHLSAYEVVVGNLIPATIGNWIGGAVCVATVYAFAYGRPNVTLTAAVARVGAAVRGWLTGAGGPPMRGRRGLAV